jgi:Uma2 family endonuclease
MILSVGSAMSTTTRVPLEVYLSSDYEPDAEYVDGEIELRPMGEFDHSSWQQAIQKWFWQHEKEWNVRVRPELRIQAAATRFRVPDVTLLDRDQPIEQIITVAPLAAFEVLSPEDRVQRMQRKLEDYSVMGIPQIWVINPEDNSFSRYVNGELLRSKTFSLAERGIVFDMREIQNLLD